MIKLTIEMKQLNMYELQKIVNLLDSKADKLDPNKNIRVYEKTEGLVLISQNGHRTPCKKV